LTQFGYLSFLPFLDAVEATTACRPLQCSGS